MWILLLTFFACGPPQAQPDSAVVGPNTTASTQTSESTGFVEDTGGIDIAELRLELDFWSYGDCNVGGLSTLWIEVTTEENHGSFEVPCSDVIDLGFDYDGPAIVQVFGYETLPPYWSPYTESEPNLATLTHGEIEVVRVEMVCYDNGVDDGCGGA